MYKNIEKNFKDYEKLMKQKDKEYRELSYKTKPYSGKVEPGKYGAVGDGKYGKTY